MVGIGVEGGAHPINACIRSTRGLDPLQQNKPNLL
jgi:hypothetical protein